MFDYLKGRWNKEDVKGMITFSHVVRDVAYNKDKDNFTVVAKDLKKDKVLEGEDFDYVIVATGHYSVPNVPSFPGVDRLVNKSMNPECCRQSIGFTIGFLQAVSHLEMQLS